MAKGASKKRASDGDSPVAKAVKEAVKKDIRHDVKWKIRHPRQHLPAGEAFKIIGDALNAFWGVEEDEVGAQLSVLIICSK